MAGKHRLGWVALSRSALRRAEAQLTQKNKGVRDELGVLAAAPHLGVRLGIDEKAIPAFELRLVTAAVLPDPAYEILDGAAEPVGQVGAQAQGRRERLRDLRWRLFQGSRCHRRRRR